MNKISSEWKNIEFLGITKNIEKIWLLLFKTHFMIEDA